MYTIDMYNISDNLSNNFLSDKVSLNFIRNIVGIGNFNLDSTMIVLIKSIKDTDLRKYNERLSQVHSNTINDTCNSPYNEIKIRIEDKLNLFHCCLY